MSMRVEVRLRSLHEDYVAAVNAAVAEERYDIVEQLVADYPDAAMREMCAAGER